MADTVVFLLFSIAHPTFPSSRNRMFTSKPQWTVHRSSQRGAYQVERTTRRHRSRLPFSFGVSFMSAGLLLLLFFMFTIAGLEAGSVQSNRNQISLSDCLASRALIGC
jgi:hypothetical protein